MSKNANVYGLLSFWGHVMTQDPSSLDIRFRTLIGLPFSEITAFKARPEASDDGEHSLSAIALSASVPVWNIHTGTLPGCVALREGDNWIGSRKDGTIFRAEKQQQWESFYPLSLEDLHLLGLILLAWFRIADSDGASTPKLGLQHFTLLWGERRFPLHLNNPIASRFHDCSLRLNTGSEIVTLEKCTQANREQCIWISSPGDIGNRALQYLTAEGVRESAPAATIQNIRLEMWGMNKPAVRPVDDSCASTGAHSYSIDTKGLGDCLRRGEVESIAIDSFTFCVDHYPSRDKCRDLLPAAIGSENVTGFGDDQLVCNVRANEILRGVHPDYIPIPARYYQLLEAESGLEMVFYGQIGDDPYSESLRRHFPHARFIGSQGPALDFETIRRSKNIAVCISTFSWLAAWLSRATRIYVPVGGIFNPAQHPEQTFLPIDDPSYRFVLLPKIKAVSLYERPTEFWQMQERISKFVRFATRAEVAEVLVRMTTPPRTRRVMCGAFDHEVYCNNYLDVAADVLALKTSALNHYLKSGYQRSHIAAFDEAFYADAYPDAATDVALGRFPSLLNHFIARGWYAGYLPCRQAVSDQFGPEYAEKVTSQQSEGTNL